MSKTFNTDKRPNLALSQRTTTADKKADPAVTMRVVKNARARGLDVLTRSQWGSAHPKSYVKRRRTHPHNIIPDGPVDTLWSHITVTRDDGILTGDFRRDMREVEHIGDIRFGAGFPYNWGIDMRTGMIGVGMPLDAKGTHTINEKGVNTPDGEPLSFNQNYVSLAIACIGMCGDVLHPRAANAYATLIAAHMDEGVLTRRFDLLPHSWCAAKECPCDSTRNQLPDIYRMAHGILRRDRD